MYIITSIIVLAVWILVAYIEYKQWKINPEEHTGIMNVKKRTAFWIYALWPLSIVFCICYMIIISMKEMFARTFKKDIQD